MVIGTTLVASYPAASNSSAGASAEFELDVTVTTDAATGYTVRRCGTSDTCAATCASACASS